MLDLDPAPPTPASRAAVAPSRLLLVAALGGLLTATTCAVGCADDEPGSELRGAGGAAASITSSRTDTSVTLESFTAECTARRGKLEIHPHCGGANSCKGMSYDAGTHVLTEHGCAGLNTCNGFSCVDPPSS